MLKQQTMKYILIVFPIYLLSFMSYGQDKNDIDLVSDFVNEIASQNPDNLENILSYTSIGEKSTSSAKDINDILKMNITSLYDRINGCDSERKIIPHSLLDEQLRETYKFQYDDLGNVYHVLCQDRIITSIIINEGKIVSFFTNLRKTDNQPVVPWILE